MIITLSIQDMACGMCESHISPRAKQTNRTRTQKKEPPRGSFFIFICTNIQSDHWYSSHLSR